VNGASAQIKTIKENNQMKTLALLASTIALLTAIVARPCFAQSGTSAVAADKTPPSYDLKPQALEDLRGLKKKFVALAEAFPSSKYGWRPGADVRSVSELFLHVSSSTYQLAPMMGAASAPGINPKTLERSPATSRKSSTS
jgi:hypothetical protein